MKRRLGVWTLVCAGWGVVWIASPGAQAPTPQGQPGKANWLTDGGDPQKNAWQRNETLITKESVKNMKLAWKLQLDNQPRQMHNLFPPLIVSDVATASGPREIAVVAGISDNLYGIDVARGAQIWKRKFDSTFVEPTGGRGPGVLCPGGLTATPVIGPTDTPGKYIAYVISWDGRLRKVDVASGQEVEPAEPFLPPERQAVRAEPLEERPLHDDRAGLRRQSQRVLLVRSRDQESRSVPARQRRDVAALRPVARQGRHALRRLR